MSYRAVGSIRSSLLVLLVLLVGCSAFDFRIVHVLRGLAGRNAIDCGVALFPANVARINACAVGATTEGVPFFFHYQLAHGSATINRGLARTASGNLLEVSIADTQASGQRNAPLLIVPCRSNALVPDATASDLKLLTCNH